MPHRYFTRELADGQAALTGSDAHHLANVMRARAGEEVVLCGPDGLEYTGTVTAIQPGRVEFSVSEGAPSKAEPDMAVTLFVGYPKQGKLDEIIRHSVELGVHEIIPFFSRYCVAAPKKEDAKNERYNRIAAEAAKQAGRAQIPHVAMPLENFDAVCRALSAYDKSLFFYEGGGSPLRELLTPGCAQRLALVTGSEGGFSTEEAAAAAEAGAMTVGLGPRILRCETAPLAALTAAMLLTGNLE
ncbi:RsmE family RNA methyltransferase [Subdoligranulum variabile]|uniref:Ribosomal RNA small subunit methyltransferase E n=1 Tax=Subdoligranulum variabile DSM 15176 TaxID=411471 RepID=D1PLV7_9FIRM|nr:RsmE family RNA methyltransferase [Subdoligranulum variabile]EFB76405.1 RNA methyltransferase, RsmE family [Subdoligranulum variabile DSM 15176]UWP67855.1 16S rRNA (uracil(1498)-N(3))-methyltransferase [Subdoligranulum variabile]